ncbi:MAG: M23 family metallopeptidase [Lachnospiraceae bacterium]|nr:M23 family metallopeptidase [Lachnospiraceae bacterium]MCI9383266.1 M23 family metallopeptidase [Lachnospiraceae bacterium]MCI9624271.1 M23 family metallopeptidase [Lachnospiraceae bacterium]
MTVKRKKKSTFTGGKSVTVAFSLCLLAVVAMIGMYTVGKSEQKEKELQQKIADAKERQEEERARQEEVRKAQEEEQKQEMEEMRKEAASASAKREKETQTADKTVEKNVINEAELESEFQAEDAEIAENVVIDEMEEAVSDAMAEEPTLSFSAETDKLFWPIAGNVILDYSMDKSIYFSTLNQYKYNPAVIIQGSLDASVMCAAQGKVTSIETLDETGTTVTMDIGNGYEVIYGQLKELTVKEGDYRKAGETIGYVSEPTKYFAQEGCNVYFGVRKDGESIDPMPLLQ